VKRLVSQDILKMNTTAGKSIGYKDSLQFLEKQQFTEESFTSFLRDFQTSSRNFAKRQLTWFRQDPFFQWIQRKSIEKSVQQITEFFLQDKVIKEDKELKEQEEPKMRPVVLKVFHNSQTITSLLEELKRE